MFKENRSLWRDRYTLFLRDKPEENRPPQTFEWLSSLVEETGCLDYKQTYRYMALGTGMHYKDAKIFFYREEHMPLPLAYLEGEKSNELVGNLASASDLAEKVRGKLWGAVNTLAKFVIAPINDLPNGRQPDPKDTENLTNHWAIERYYWSALEIPFLHFVEDLPRQSEALDIWKETVRRAAWDALEQATNFAGTDATALKAAVRARSVLGGALKDLFPERE